MDPLLLRMLVGHEWINRSVFFEIQHIRFLLKSLRDFVLVPEILYCLFYAVLYVPFDLLGPRKSLEKVKSSNFLQSFDLANN